MTKMIYPIVAYGHPILKKKAAEISPDYPELKQLVEDMFETMYEANGVGLAAPQVGILKRIFVIDVTGEDPMVFINPEILETSGEQTGYEGCLSVPGKSGVVTRPNYVKAKAFDLEGNEFIIEGEELLARAILHENDHLNGTMYVEKVEGELVDNEELIAQQEEEEE